MMTKKILSIADLIKGDLKLASPPNLYFELQKTIDDRTQTMADAAFIIEKDAGLSIRLLKIVNSALYGLPKQVISIQQAINFIGTKELQNLTLSTLIMDKFSDLPSKLISMHDFWASNLRCALIAQEIDQYLGQTYKDSAFISGLLHNIGHLVLLQRLPELVREVSLNTLYEETTSLADEITYEEKIIGFDRFQVGAALTQHWKLPDALTESIRLHTAPEEKNQFQRLATIIRTANSYSQIDSYEIVNIDNLGIFSEDMAQLIDRALLQFEEIFKLFYH